MLTTRASIRSKIIQLPQLQMLVAELAFWILNPLICVATIYLE